MKIIPFFSIISFLSFFPICASAAEEGAAEVLDNSATMRENMISNGRAQKLSLDRYSEDYQRAAIFYSGQNILNVCNVDYVEGFLSEKYSLNYLFGLYESLRMFLGHDGTFSPDELNEGFAKPNYEFLRSMFEGND